jgi:hypothetical protein
MICDTIKEYAQKSGVKYNAAFRSVRDGAQTIRLPGGHKARLLKVRITTNERKYYGRRMCNRRKQEMFIPQFLAVRSQKQC